MPIQTFEPMTKDFATFDCDAHVTEPPLIWERAGEFLTRDDRAYNEWAYGYTKANPDRLFFAALLPMQNPA